MKKGKVLSKGHLALGIMVLVLGAAVWLNMKYSSVDKTKYMGESTFVSNQNEDSAMVSGKIEEDYFSTAKTQRETAYLEAEESIKEALNSAAGNADAVKDATDKAAALSKRKTDEVAIENILNAKGFNKSLAVIGDNSVTVIVEGETLTNEQTLIIQDAVSSQCEISSSKVKIVTVKG